MNSWWPNNKIQPSSNPDLGDLGRFRLERVYVTAVPSLYSDKSTTLEGFHAYHKLSLERRRCYNIIIVINICVDIYDELVGTVMGIIQCCLQFGQGQQFV